MKFLSNEHITLDKKLKFVHPMAHKMKIPARIVWKGSSKLDSLW
jgi:hypothetical protein